MSQDKKTNKRKILIRYLILAACILVIAAVTVTTVFAVNDWFRSDISIDSGNVNNPDDKNPDDNKPDEPDKPTINDNTFLCPVAELNITRAYDFGKDVSLGHWHWHEGVDMSAEVGTAVNACLDGTIESIVLGDELDGNTVTLKHANGLTTVYSFIDVASGLKKGDSVKRGDKLGTVAKATGSEFNQDAHLHFEVYENGKQTDPAKFLDIADK